MYAIFVKFHCVPGKREGFVEKMEQTGILQAIRDEDGCLKYEYYYSQRDPDELLLIEQWQTKEHQQIHIGQPHMARMQEFRNDYILNASLGEFEYK